MTTSVNTNFGAMVALQNLNKTNSELDQVQNRINTGFRVASAKDNGAIFSIAESMRGDVKGLSVALNTIGNAKAIVDTAMAAGDQLTEILKEMKEKAVAAKDPSLTTTQRAAYNNDFVSLRNRFQQVVNNASFNGVNLLSQLPTVRGVSAFIDAKGNVSTSQNGLNLNLANNNVAAAPGPSTWSVVNSATIAVAATTGAVTIAGTPTGVPTGFVAYDSNGSQLTGAIAASGTLTNFATVDHILNATTGEKYRLGDQDADGVFDSLVDYNTGALALLTTDSNGAANAGGTTAWVTANSLGVTIRDTMVIDTAARASAAAAAVEQTLGHVTSQLATLGTFARGLDGYKTLLGKISDSLEAGIGNLVDADMPRESAKLQSLQIKQQLGAQALGIANQSPQIILSLFGGR
jgi:flagellin